MKFFFAGVAVLAAQSALADLAESPDGHIMDILLPASVAQDHFIATAEAQER